MSLVTLDLCPYFVLHSYLFMHLPSLEILKFFVTLIISFAKGIFIFQVLGKNELLLFFHHVP